MKWIAAALLLICASGQGQDLRVVAPQNTLTISPVKLVFAEQAAGSSSTPQGLTLANESAVPIRITQVLASGIDFRINNTCGSELGVGNHCSIHVVFQPATIGERLGVVEIISSDAGSPHYVSLAGIGK